MSQIQKLLFVCSHNLQRSITAERLYQGFNGYEVMSAGTEPEARVRVSEELLQWADIVFVMEQKHIEKLRKKFGRSLKGRRLICLGIPDRYGYMSFELIRVLKERLGVYIEVPK
jgi:predicted protein tyrosine phosphatase